MQDGMPAEPPGERSLRCLHRERAPFIGDHPVFSEVAMPPERVHLTEPVPRISLPRLVPRERVQLGLLHRPEPDVSHPRSLSIHMRAERAGPHALAPPRAPAGDGPTSP